MRQMLAVCSAIIVGAAAFAILRPLAAEPTAKNEDPWTGTYFKYGEYQADRVGQFGDAPKITIAKVGDVYKLSKPYDSWEFKETDKGVLKSDVGTIKLGSMAFSDGSHGRIFRAEFCYEWFFLAGSPTIMSNSPAKTRKKNLPEEKASAPFGYAYYLFESPGNGDGANSNYIPLWVTRAPLEAKECTHAVVIQTYERDSIWKLEDRPVEFRRDAVEPKARRISKDGKVYRYQRTPIGEVIRLLNNPVGQIPLHIREAPISKSAQPILKELIRDLSGIDDRSRRPELE